MQEHDGRRYVEATINGATYRVSEGAGTRLHLKIVGKRYGQPRCTSSRSHGVATVDFAYEGYGGGRYAHMTHAELLAAVQARMCERCAALATDWRVVTK